MNKEIGVYRIIMMNKFKIIMNKLCNLQLFASVHHIPCTGISDIAERHYLTKANIGSPLGRGWVLLILCLTALILVSTSCILRIILRFILVETSCILRIIL